MGGNWSPIVHDFVLLLLLLLLLLLYNPVKLVGGEQGFLLWSTVLSQSHLGTTKLVSCLVMHTVVYVMARHAV
ncbi:hypothetical protein F5Y19DRAFT_454025 [Xylariaceae sp. FL1651]|nr:hypothetical protein F5Y19DRAFT_454025 [Xylariaceae sp. FL1651]